MHPISPFLFKIYILYIKQAKITRFLRHTSISDGGRMRTVRLFTVLCVLIFPVPLRRRCGTARLKHGCLHRPLNIASRRIANNEHMIREQEWKQLHTSSHNTYSVLVYVCLLLLTLYVLYKLYNCFKNRTHSIRTITDTNGSENTVNIKKTPVMKA